MKSKKEIPAAVKRLRLTSAFKGYNPGILDCIEISSDDSFMLVDDEACTHISTREEDSHKCCYCLNPNKNEIIVLPLDKKLIKHQKGGMADGAVFDESKFAFVEFKDQAQGNTFGAIQETYTKASEQLSAALNLFVDKLKKDNAFVKFTNLINVFCHIIVSDKFPRENALEQNMKVAFAMSNHGVGLSFERRIEFNDRTERDGKAEIA